MCARNLRRYAGLHACGIQTLRSISLNPKPSSRMHNSSHASDYDYDTTGVGPHRTVEVCSKAATEQTDESSVESLE